MTAPGARAAALALAAVLAVAAVPAARGADDPVSRGAALVAKGRYGEAAALLRAAIPAGGAARSDLCLTLGVAYLLDARLHRDLFLASVELHLDYLGRLAGERGREESRLVALHLGEALLAAKRAAQARPRFESFLAGRAGSGDDRDAARIGKALCDLRTGKAGEARAALDTVRPSGPEGETGLAAARLEAGAIDANRAAQACDRALAAARAAGGRPTARTVRSALAVYARAGRLADGVALAAAADPGAFAREEVLGRNKAVRFHDVALLDALATLYGEASSSWLVRAADDEGFRDRATARLFLAEARAFQGQPRAAAEAAGALAASPGVPLPLKARAEVRRAASLHAAGRRDEGARELSDLAARHAADPDLLAEILLSCARGGIPCDAAAGRAVVLAEAGEARQVRALRAALGRYRLARGDAAGGLALLEAARDKGNKNRVEFNDPGMLVALAGAYYRARNFTEAQEILFGVGAAVPAARQAQEALQGVHAREQRSAGDARIL